MTKSREVKYWEDVRKDPKTFAERIADELADLRYRLSYLPKGEARYELLYNVVKAQLDSTHTLLLLLRDEMKVELPS